MRALTAIMVLAGLAMGIPLRKGASLGYKVWRGWESDSTFATLTMLDSALTDSGTSWWVGIRDSLVGGKIRVDTAYFQHRALDTVWTKPSCLMAWDLQHYRAGDPAPASSFPFRFGGLGTVCAYGNKDSLGQLNTTAFNFSVYTINGDQRTFYYYSTILGVHTGSFPTLVESPYAGWIRVEEPFLGEIWVLQRMNGIPVSDTSLQVRGSELFTPLPVGEEWTWSTAHHISQTTPILNLSSESDTSFDVHWVVHEIQSDSGGWLRRRLQEDTGRINLRIRLIDGAVSISPSEQIRNLIATGFVHLPNDSATVSGAWIRSTPTSVYTMEPGSGPFSYSSNLVSSVNASQEGMPIIVTTTEGVQFNLVRHVPSSLNRAVLDRRQSIQSADHIRQVLDNSPGVSIRLSSFDGRSRTIHASSELRGLHGLYLAQFRMESGGFSEKIFFP
jgi:hypothetical protein